MGEQVESIITGDEIFFDFIEADYQDPLLNKDLVSKIHSWEIQGVVVRNVFSEEEVADILDKMSLIPESMILNTKTGTSFPDPFATITDSEERLDNYIAKTDTFLQLPFTTLLTRLEEFFNRIEQTIKPSVSRILGKNKWASPGNFRVLPQDKGGLFVHCGYLFQQASPHYYKVVNEMEKEGQLSYFVVLQNSEEGGALTIYDMLWKDIKNKDVFDGNEYVLKPNGEKWYLKDIPQFAVRPNPGDVLIFAGGPIWHRVEPVKGRPRITFGGFINFSKDSGEFYYWS